MSALSPARRAALDALMSAARDGAYVRDAVAGRAAAAGLDRRDAALAMRLALGATACRGRLDEALDAHLSRPASVRPAVREALRISTFEILYLGTRVDAAVSQGVELARSRSRGAAGLANAVLRRVAASRDGFLSVDGGEGRARRAGMPTWLVREIGRSLGPERASEVLACELEPAPVAIHLGPHATPLGREEELLPGTVLGADASDPALRRALELGRAVASDANAQLVSAIATAAGRCLEVGAGRGTKTFVMADLARRAGLSREHVACDLAEGKCRSNLERLDAAGLAGGVRALWGDCRDLDRVLAPLDAVAPGGRALFDTVLVDAPCSGTGTMRRHPEIPWRLDEDDLRALPEIQLALIEAASERVVPGGRLVYATCSIIDAENGSVVDAFLAGERGSAFSRESVSRAPFFSLDAGRGARAAVSDLEDASGALGTWPVPGGYDGHFCAQLVRRA